MIMYLEKYQKRKWSETEGKKKKHGGDVWKRI